MNILLFFWKKKIQWFFGSRIYIYIYMTYIRGCLYMYILNKYVSQKIDGEYPPKQNMLQLNDFFYFFIFFEVGRIHLLIKKIFHHLFSNCLFINIFLPFNRSLPFPICLQLYIFLNSRRNFKIFIYKKNKFLFYPPQFHATYCLTVIQNKNLSNFLFDY